MEENKTQGTISIVVAGFVMVSAMFEPMVSSVIAVVALLGLGIWQFMNGAKNTPADLIGEEVKVKEENKKKILDFVVGKDQITNNDVEKLLKVSSATAERYLDELEKSGALKQVGKTGRSVFYSKV